MGKPSVSPAVRNLFNGTNTNHCRWPEPASPETHAAPAFQLSSRVRPCYPCATHRSVTARVCVAVRASIFRVLALTSPLQFFLPWRALQSQRFGSGCTNQRYRRSPCPQLQLRRPPVSPTLRGRRPCAIHRMAHSSSPLVRTMPSESLLALRTRCVCVTEVVPALSPSSHPACAQLGSRTLVTIVLDQLVNMWPPAMVATAHCCRERYPPSLHTSNRRRVS